jgi:hypothetical protein
VGGVDDAAFLGDGADAPFEVGGWRVGVGSRATDGRVSRSSWSMRQRPVSPGEVEHECAPVLTGFAGGQGRGDLAGQVPVEVDVADVGGQHGIAGTGPRRQRSVAVAAVLGGGDHAFEVFGWAQATFDLEVGAGDAVDGGAQLPVGRVSRLGGGHVWDPHAMARRWVTACGSGGWWLARARRAASSSRMAWRWAARFSRSVGTSPSGRSGSSMPWAGPVRVDGGRDLIPDPS